MRVLGGVVHAIGRILTTFMVGVCVVLVLFGWILRLLPSSRSSPDLSRWSEWPRPSRNQWFDW
jgi:hypothetical protein